MVGRATARRKYIVYSEKIYCLLREDMLFTQRRHIVCSKKRNIQAPDIKNRIIFCQIKKFVYFCTELQFIKNNLHLLT